MWAIKVDAFFLELSTIGYFRRHSSCGAPPFETSKGVFGRAPLGLDAFLSIGMPILGN
jgi:hypothetical protein